MASFALEDGEVVVRRQPVKSTSNAWLQCELILTDRRVVLTAQDNKPGLASVLWFFGALGGLLGAVADRRKTSISHEIRKADFASAVVTGSRDLKVDSNGEGYGKVWFEVSTKRPEEWADALHAWASGHSARATLPSAKLVDR